MCGDENILEKKKTCDLVLKLAIDAATTARVKGVTSIVVSGGTCESVNLHDTLYVTNLRTNLVSVFDFTDRGKIVNFDDKWAMVKDADGKVVILADRIGDMYFVRAGASEHA